MLVNGVRASRLARQVFAVALMAVLSTMAMAAPAPQGRSDAGPATMQDEAPMRLAVDYPPPRPKPGPKGSIETSGVRLRAVLAEGAPSLEHGIEWRVWAYADAGDPIVSRDAIAEIELAPGRYIARVAGGLASAETDFTVEYDKVTRVSVVLDAGAIEAAVLPGAAAMPLDLATLTLRRAGSTDAPLISATGGRLDAVLPAGSYELEASVGLVTTTLPIEVRAGATTKSDVTLEVGFIVADAVAAEGTEPLTEATFSLSHLAGGPVGDGETAAELARASGRRGIFAVAPGEYQLTGRYGLAEVAELVRVTPNALTQVTMTLDAARLELVAIGPDTGSGPASAARFRVLREEAGGAPELVTEIVGAGPTLRLPAGTYLVEADRDGVSTTSRVRLAAGERAAVRLVLGGGEVNVRPVAALGIAEGARIELSAAPDAGFWSDGSEPIALGQLSASPIPLPAGDYRIYGRLVPGGATSQAAVTVRPGERGDAELRFEVGAARLTVLDKAGGTALDDARWVLRADGATNAIRASGGLVELSLAPGTYKVLAEAGARGAAGEITVTAGAVAELSLVAE